MSTVNPASGAAAPATPPAAAPAYTPASGSTLGSAAAPRAAADHLQYLTFFLGEEMFAIGILAIREIIEYGQVTGMPMAPPFIRGVINLRGAVVPVVDLAVRFGRKPAAATKKTCIVIIEIATVDDQRQLMGIVVDSVSEVLEISATDIEPPPSFGSRLRNDFIAGMARIGEHFVVLLNMDRILSLDEIAAVVALKPPQEG